MSPFIFAIFVEVPSLVSIFRPGLGSTCGTCIAPLPQFRYVSLKITSASVTTKDAGDVRVAFCPTPLFGSEKSALSPSATLSRRSGCKQNRSRSHSPGCKFIQMAATGRKILIGRKTLRPLIERGSSVVSRRKLAICAPAVDGAPCHYSPPARYH